MPEQEDPLGISDLLMDPSVATIAFQYPPYSETWFWCRRHSQKHRLGPCDQYKSDWENYSALCAEADKEGWQRPVRPPLCIDIGPFMSEQEAMRCGALGAESLTGRQRSTGLGMDIEVARGD